MFEAQKSWPATAPGMFVVDAELAPPVRVRPNAPPAPMLEIRGDNEFIAMLNAFRDSGGLSRAEDVVRRFSDESGADMATLRGWIERRQVIGFDWEMQTWLPLFQFDRFSMTPRPELGLVFAELKAVYDPWDLAHWFARPNSSLGGRRPVDTIARDMAAVRHAARADRFVALG